jgi:hypothetical protein
MKNRQASFHCGVSILNGGWGRCKEVKQVVLSHSCNELEENGTDKKEAPEFWGAGVGLWV